MALLRNSVKLTAASLGRRPAAGTSRGTGYSSAARGAGKAAAGAGARRPRQPRTEGPRAAARLRR
eukprot:10753053-Lingulodinium_polyedra.AAC.1